MIFAQMLEIVALSDLASVLCARSFSFAPQGGCTPNCPLFIYYYYFIILIIIIIKALRLAAVVFILFFLIWPPPRDLSIARLLVPRMSLDSGRNL